MKHLVTTRDGELPDAWRFLIDTTRPVPADYRVYLRRRELGLYVWIIVVLAPFTLGLGYALAVAV